MAVSSKFILQQGPLLGSLAKTAAAAAMQQVMPREKSTPTTPGPEFSATLAPRSPDLVKAYVKHVGGEPSAYRSELPAHLFPQWSFVLASKTLDNIPYPLMKVMGIVDLNETAVSPCPIGSASTSACFSSLLIMMPTPVAHLFVLHRALSRETRCASSSIPSCVS